MRTVLALIALAASACRAGANDPTPDAIRAAAERATALLQSSQKNWFSHQSCSSCHHQFLPAMAFRDAREHGIAVNDDLARADAAKAYAHLSDIDRAVQYTHMIDASLDDGYRLLGADAAGLKPNLVAAVYARHIALRQRADGHWSTIDVRPPQSHDFITATAVSLRAIQLYHHGSLAEDADRRVALARDWLKRQRATTTEDRAYQLLGLSWAGASKSDMSPLVDALAADQREDGGWNSVNGRDSDAYSTGEALVVLHDIGGIDSTDPRWRKGMQFLLDTQAADGSWHVFSRLRPPVNVSPPYFETGYPYGHDQVISAMGASWAIRALARALPPTSTTMQPAQPRADVEPWMETALFGTVAELRAALDNHLDPNAASKAGTSVLMMSMPDVEKARLLIERGADVRARAKSRYSALLVAAQYPDSLPAIELLMAHGADVRLPKGGGMPLFNATALSLAVMAGNIQAAPLFLKAGDRFDEKFWSLGMVPSVPVQYPVEYGDVDNVRALLDVGLPVDFVDDDKMTLLDWAVMANRVSAARLLIERGADVNHVDRYGMTPLQHAASVDFGDAEMIQLLRKSGARTEARTKDGKTALDLARAYGHANLMAGLQQ